MNKLKNIVKSPYMIFVLFALKLVVYYGLIDVKVSNLVFPIVSVLIMGLIFIGISHSKFKGKIILFLLVYSGFSILMFADSMYYNYYNQTVSVKQLWQAANVAAVPKSFIETLIPASFLLYIDIPFVYFYFKKYVRKESINKLALKREGKYILAGITCVFAILVVNPFDSVAIEKVNSVEFFTNHVSDIYAAISENIGTEEIPVAQVIEEVEEVKAPIEGNQYNAIGEGKNLILIQLEATQEFVVGATYNGEVLTPNLNQLLEEDTLYYDNFYSNIGKGNTVDAEFSTLNSLYPSIDRESYTLYQDNEYNGLPWLLREKGYDTLTIHGYKGEFWNRENAYPNQGISEFYSMEDLDMTDIIGMGISDKSLFSQSIDILKDKENPFFAFIITLTNHHPYTLSNENSTLALKEEHIGTKFGNYLQTIRYQDEALGQFIEDLKANGMYENTVLAMYGDHHGLNVGMDNNEVIVSEYLGKTYDYDEMLNVPMLIHVPNSGVKETISTTGGQIDFLPTIANVMNIELNSPFILGQDLTNATDGFVAFTAYLFDGSFVSNNVMFEISREGVFDGSRAWDIHTGEVLDASLYENEYNKAVALKKSTKDILTQNIIRHNHMNETSSHEISVDGIEIIQNKKQETIEGTKVYDSKIQGKEFQGEEPQGDRLLESLGNENEEQKSGHTLDENLENEPVLEENR